jgi:cation diffusion facilitator family transporter
MRWVRTYHHDEAVAGAYRRALIISLTGNLLLAVIKGLAAYISGSAAVYADAINSVSDVLYSILLIVGLWMALRPPDHSHPQGHSRFEPFAALFVTFTMAFAGFEAGRSSIVRFVRGSEPLTIGIPLVILAVSVGAKVVMYIFIKKAAVRASSPGLEAAAGDNISDVTTSIAAAIGIAGASYVHPILDPIFGLLVSIWIFKSVIELAKENLGYLTGAGADPELVERFRASVAEIDGVENVHHIITEFVGPKLIVDMHINVDGDLTLNAAHDICDSATEKLEKFTQVDRAYVHVEPVGYQ